MRYWFGGGPADYVVSPGDRINLTGEVSGYHAALVPGVRLWVWDHNTGERVTDLLDGAGQQVDHLISADYGEVTRFRGPDEVRRLLIGPEPADPTNPDDPDGDQPEDNQQRWIITSSDWPTIVSGVEARVSTLEQGGGGGEDPGDVIATAHPLIWTHPGPVEETRQSPHPYWNEEGKTQTIPRVRAQTTITSGQLTVSVLSIDPDTGTTTVVAALLLDAATPGGVVTPDAIISAGTGVTVAVELADESTDATDVTVQVMIR